MSETANTVDFWSNWPQWDDEHTFRTPNLTFVSSWTKPDEQPFSRDRIPVEKSRRLVDCYPNILRGYDIRTVAEIGYLYGGMVLLFADMMPRAKVIGIDRNQPPPAMMEVVANHNLMDRVHFYGGASQENRDLVRSILDKEFGDEPLDLIIDDASHFYDESKATFEACFGYLRPGGIYIIEDWGWAHCPEVHRIEPNSSFFGKSPLTRLLFELTMILARRPGTVARLDIINDSMAVVTRGNQLAHRATIDIDSSYVTTGHRFVGFAQTLETRNAAVKGKLRDAHLTAKKVMGRIARRAGFHRAWGS